MGSEHVIEREEAAARREEVDGVSEQGPPRARKITLAEVNRVLEAGQLLASVLAPEELSEMRVLLEERASANG